MEGWRDRGRGRGEREVGREGESKGYHGREVAKEIMCLI